MSNLTYSEKKILFSPGLYLQIQATAEITCKS